MDTPSSFPPQTLRDEGEPSTTTTSSGNGSPVILSLLINDKEAALCAIKRDGKTYLYGISPDLRTDKDVTMAAVSQSGKYLSCAPDALKDDKDVVLKALANYPGALKYASDRLRKDKNLALAAVTCHWRCLEHLGYQIRGDQDVIEQTISSHKGFGSSDFAARQASRSRSQSSRSSAVRSAPLA